MLQKGSASYTFYTEVDWLCPEEIRLLSALALSVPHGLGKVSFYTEVHPQNVAFQTTPWREALIRSELGEFVSHIVRIWEAEAPNLEQPEVWAAITEIAKHQTKEIDHFTGSYAFQPQTIEPQLRDDIYANIDLTDELLLRGLSCLLKGEMLARHYFFIEEAAINAYIALEAALTIILRAIDGSNGKIPKMTDALQYVEATFPNGAGLADYFRLSYDNRIRTLHPESRFGASWAAPLMADDYLETYDELTSVYRYLLTGQL